MDWLDDIIAQAAGDVVLNDSKTPSGTIHVGSLRGPILLDVLGREFRRRGVPTRVLYGLDDLDPMDAQALLTPDAISAALGRPLAAVADPAGDCHLSYAAHFAALFLDTFGALGIHIDELYVMSELYADGHLDPYIIAALERATLVRALYERVAKVRHPADWHPLMVICESCGRIGTTMTTAWDGTLATYTCRVDGARYTQGCGYIGTVSPLGGRAKLPWNLEWAAQWSLFGVTIEPSGKDLSTAGGARARADAIAREVFEREPPLNVPYEFLNVGGRKMSSSGGTGAPAHEIGRVLPPAQLRFLFLRRDPNTAIDFAPFDSDAIPRLFDEFDRFATVTGGAVAQAGMPADYADIYTSTLVDPEADAVADAQLFRPAFGQLAFLLQQPDIDLETAMAAEKGAPLTADEGILLDERVAAARAWLADYAPARARFAVDFVAVPEAASVLDSAQRAFLLALAAAAQTAQPAGGETWQALLFATAASLALPSGQAFAALYLAFLGRPSGPRAGWLLAGLAPEFVLTRLAAAGDS